MSIKYKLILFFFLASILGYSQSYNFHTYTVEDGLSQSQVKGLYQDGYGNLWIGTVGGGVSKFNSKKFINYTTNNGLVGDNITCITGDKWGNIWVGTESKGISKYKNQKFTPYNTNSGLISNHITALCSDSSGNLWVGTEEGLCVMISTDSTHSFYRLYKFSEKDGLSSNKITTLFTDRKNRVWIGTDKGISYLEKEIKTTHQFTFSKIDEKEPAQHITGIAQDQNGYLWFASTIGVRKLISKFGDKHEFIFYNSKNGLLTDKINSITADKKGNIWLCFDQGVTRIIFENNTSKLEVINYTFKSGLPEGHINYCVEDREGNLWFGTENGLTRYSGDRFIAYTKEHGLINNNVHAIAGDKDGNILIGTNDGIGKMRLSGNAMTFEDYAAALKLNVSPVQSIYQDKDNTIWIGTQGAVVKLEAPKSDKLKSFKSTRFDNKDFFDGSVNAILQDSKGNIWFATSSGLVRYDGESFKKYTRSEGLPDNNVLCLLEDRKGLMWMGTERGLCSYDGKGITKMGAFSVLKMQVSSLVEDDAGNFWIGSSSGGGLTRFDGQNYVNISEPDGMLSTIYLLELDNTGALWIGTNKGLDLFDVSYYNKSDTVRYKHYAKLEGFTGVACNHNAVYKDFNGNIWFGTVKGVVKYAPKEDLQNNVSPIIQLQSIRLFNKEDVDWSKYADSISPVTGLPIHLHLPYSQNYLTFNFLGVSLTNSEKVRYKYKLEGFRDEWEETSDLSIPFTNLPAGKYTFYVKASNNDGVWNENPVSFHFVISPPFWTTPLFYFLTLITVSLLIWLIIRRRTKQLEKSKKELEQKIVERTKELHEKNIELEKLSIVARETVNGIVIANQMGEIEWVNESYTRMTGYTLHDLKNGDGKTMFQNKDNPELKKIIIECLASKQSKIFESLVETKEAKKIWIHTTLTPIFDEEGKVKKFVFIDTDITETKAAEEIIRLKNKDMMDSINYAKLIQDAILPPKDEILRVFPKSFLFFMPREVVSGDFYWFNVIGDTAFIAVADSTGHGVPGAFMSLIGSSLLNEIVIQKGIHQTDLILNELDKEIRTVLKQGKEGVGTRDGMDVALCAINLKTNLLHFSGAMRPMYIVNKKQTIVEGSDQEYDLRVISPDKRSIGGDQEGRIAVFSRNEIQLVSGDTIYMFTDGYADQFGGPRGKKITNARFKESFLSLQVLSMKMQGKLLEQDLLKWKGNLEQVDDILVLGVKF